jgi:hypothetical protein
VFNIINSGMMASLAPDMVPLVLIPTSAVLGIVFALWLWKRVSLITVNSSSNVFHSSNGREYLLEEEQRGDDEVIDQT